MPESSIDTNNTSNNEEKSDIWSNLSALSEGMAGLTMDSYWFAQLADLISNEDEDIFGVSYSGIGVGAILGGLSACCSYYCHLKLNHYHQKANASDQDTSSTKKSLTAMQKFALVFDFTSHALESASPLSFVISLAGGQHTSRLTQLGIFGGTFIAGSLAAVAPTRNCMSTLKRIPDQSKDPLSDDQQCNPRYIELA